MERTARIGKITLDYSEYSGEDLYCDGAVEDELLEIVKNVPPREYARIIEERKSWPILYHLSPLRANIVDWIPIDAWAKVLEVGSGCGAITGTLSSKAAEVTCVELSRKRSQINAYRHKNRGNVTIHVGNFKDIEPKLDRNYDYICLIGVFEYGQSYIGGHTPYEDFLKILMPHLAEGGRIVIAIENKYGLKYFAGCMEDHLGTYFSGIENYAMGGGVRTFGKNGLEHIFRSCGVSEVHFYYPYPDYKFMTALYSDQHLPGKGELSNNIRNFDRDRMLLFDEKYAFDGLVEEGLFPVFSNSYAVVVGEGFDVEYVKYSNDRAPEYVIKTQISTNERGQRAVCKYPLSREAEAHVKNMAAACESLTKRYHGGGLRVNQCTLSQEPELCARFEYLSGRPLSEYMDCCLEKNDLEGFYGYFREYLRRISYNSEWKVWDFDLIFSNILVDGDVWTLIDYEWTFDKSMDPRRLAFRALYCYLLEDKRREKLDMGRALQELCLTWSEAECLKEQEMDFQKFVTGGRLSMAQIRELTGGGILTPEKWIGRYQDEKNENRIQIYEDTGKGYSEEESYFPEDFSLEEGTAELSLSVNGNVKMLRIDPAMDFCAVKILEMTLNEKRVPLERRGILVANGRVARPAEKNRGGGPTIVFPTADPNIHICMEKLETGAENRLNVKLEIRRLPESMADDMAAAIKRLI